MSKVFESLVNGSLIDTVSGTKGTFTAGSSRGFIQTDKGLSLSLKSNSYFVMDNEITLSRNASSISFWYKHNGWISGNYLDSHFILGNVSQFNQYIMVKKVTDEYGSILIESDTNGDYWAEMGMGINLTIGIWYHIVITANNGTITSYNNNISFGSKVVTDDLSLKEFSTSNSATRTNGCLENIKIYDHVLTTKERNDLYIDFLQSTQTSSPKQGFDWGKDVDLSNLSDDGLVAAYNMTNVKGQVMDLSGNGKHGTINGAMPTEDGMAFDGSNDISLINSLSLSDVSICVRIKFPSLSASEKKIIDRTLSINSLVEIYKSVTNTIIFRVRGDNGVGISLVESNNSFNENDTLDVVAIRDTSSGLIKLSINGDSFISATDNTTSNFSHILKIGNSQNGLLGMDGIIEDVRIYNVAKDAQFAKDYHNSFVKPVFIETWEDNGADEVVKLPRGWLAGTGSFYVEEVDYDI